MARWIYLARFFFEANKSAFKAQANKSGWKILHWIKYYLDEYIFSWCLAKEKNREMWRNFNPERGWEGWKRCLSGKTESRERPSYSFEKTERVGLNDRAVVCIALEDVDIQKEMPRTMKMLISSPMKTKWAPTHSLLMRSIWMSNRWCSRCVYSFSSLLFPHHCTWAYFSCWFQFK